MHKLKELLVERISSGLKRKTITCCSAWAERYRVMGPPFAGSWSFKYHPWTRAIHDATEEMVIGQKAAQLGFTECALNKVFYGIDILGHSCLYVLPASTPDASDFSTARFDPALEASEHLSSLFSDVKNIGHKRAGSANLYIRGSRSKSQLRSIPVNLGVFDEVDVMVQENITLALERMSGQLDKQAFLLSTPTIGNFGISAYYEQSSQDHFMFKCPMCSKHTELTFPECIDITAESFNDIRIKESTLRCKECHGILESSLDGKSKWLQSGEWVSSYTDRMYRGFHVNQLYSCTIKPWEIAQLYLKSTTNPTDEQEFFNSKLGLPHVVEGAQIQDSDIEECTGDYKIISKIPRQKSFVTMGIDVGKVLHYEIDSWTFNKNAMTLDTNLNAYCKVLRMGKVENFNELAVLMQQFGVVSCVIDANPEKRAALSFAQTFPGRVKLCYYGRGVNGKNINEHAEEEYTLTVDRTSWLDLSLGRFRSKQIKLPIDTSLEYKNHIKAIVRIYEKDADGNQVGRYVTGNEDDHFAHARNYAEIALKIGVNIFTHSNVTGVY